MDSIICIFERFVVCLQTEKKIAMVTRKRSMRTRNPAPESDWSQSRKEPVRARWVHADALPQRRVVEYEYFLPQDYPIHGFVKTYAQPQQQAGFDMHYALECGFVMAGRTARYAGGLENRWVCGPGDVWFSPSYEPNGYQIVEAPCTVAVFEIEPELVAGLRFPELPRADWLRPFSAPLAQRPRRPRDPERLLDIGRRLAACGNPGDPRNRLTHRLLLIEFLTLFVEADANGAAEPSARRHEDIQPAIDLALDSRRFLRNEEGAEACGMSRDAFIRTFRKVTGVSFAKFAQRHRLQGASNDLVVTDLPVKAVAANWGFTDESHLHHLFQRYYGCSPAAFRAKARGGPPRSQA